MLGVSSPVAVPGTAIDTVAVAVLDTVAAVLDTVAVEKGLEEVGPIPGARGWCHSSEVAVEVVLDAEEAIVCLARPAG